MFAKKNPLKFKFKNANVDYSIFFNGITVSTNGFKHCLSSTPVTSHLLILSTQWYLIESDGKDVESPANDVLNCEFDVVIVASRAVIFLV